MSKTNRMENMKRRLRPLARRAAAGFLSLAMLGGMAPAVAPQAQAADNWAQEYLDQLVEWSVMRGDIDGNLYADRNITRAEFVTMVDRAYGYDQVGGTPFTDVQDSSWYADDISIAYNVGYFQGTSRTTASPDDNLTREQAVLLLGRNMMLQSSAGETLGFSDSRDFSEWSRTMVQAAADAGVVGGYPDGTFRPQNHVTRGEVAKMLVQAVGTPISEPGEHELGSVYGNVTISSSGVTLRNTVIAGDLYLTGGIGLGDVLLENVTVLGKIMASGAGESNQGESSIILRNVTADEMVVDSISNQFVTVRSEGDTDIASTSIRTHAYVEDITPENYGLKMIEINAENGSAVQLAGNIKEVKNLTPGSKLTIAQGSAAKVTVDEKAVGSSVSLENNARVGELNLDIGTSVAGNGDIDKLNVNAAGSTVGMLPDQIAVRPGVTANIAGTTMDNVAAAESSADPRLLAGYPAAHNVAPTSADAVFSANKAGTVYWAVSALADGSVNEEDVISPPAYSGKILKSGSIKVTASKTEMTAKLSGLTSDGSYYITSVMVDSRGQRSPVKVTAFTTPDNTTPNFASGYPVMTKLTMNTAQVTVMTTKSCQLYYALLPKGSAAPKAQDFKAGAITGNLGYGSIDAVKNSTIPFQVNNVDLEELTSYDLYLWLTDYDGTKSSAVKKLSFTTIDGTPPVIQHAEQSGEKATSAEVTFSLNEPGTLYWAVYQDEADFPYIMPGETAPPALTDLVAKTQVQAAIGAIKKGNSNANKADTDVKFNVSGLKAQTAYYLFYVAKDKAGNFSSEVKKLELHTLDNEAPKAELEFTKYNGDDKNAPLPDTDIRVVFSEKITPRVMNNGKWENEDIYEAYKTARDAGINERPEKQKEFADMLKKHIRLYVRPATGQPVEATERTAANAATTPDWLIDYRYATVTEEDGKTVVTFPTKTGAAKDTSALNLASGATYYFRLEGIFDRATVPNQMGNTNLPDFRTVFAQVSLSQTNVESTNVGGVELDPYQSASFLMEPISVERVEPNMLWDMLIWTDTSMTYSIYSRDKDAGNDAWKLVKADNRINVSAAPDGYAYHSLGNLTKTGVAPIFGKINEMKDTEYAIRIDAIGDSNDPSAWNRRVNLKFTIVAGPQAALQNLASGSYITNWEESQKRDGVVAINLPEPFEIRKQFSDSAPPKFVDNYPNIAAGDIVAEVSVMIDRPGQVYYVAVPLTNVKYDGGDTYKHITDYSAASRPAVAPESAGGMVVAPGDRVSGTDMPLPKVVPNGGDASSGWKPLLLSSPGVNTITSGNFTGDVRHGTSPSMVANNAATLRIENLKPDTEYFLYLVTKGTGAVYSEYASCYRFKTEVAVRPVITMSITNPNVIVKVDRDTNMDYMLVRTGSEDSQFHKKLVDVIDNVAIDEKYKDMTVLDAMSTDIIKGNVSTGTVFDTYAPIAVKNDYASLIRNQSVSGTDVVMIGKDKPFKPVAEGTTVNCTGMTGSNYYTFIAVGRSTMGSGDAFRAARPVFLRDTEAPIVTEVIANLRPQIKVDANGDPILDANNQEIQLNKVEGYITLVFSEPLYAREKSSSVDQTTIPVDNCIRGNHSGDTDWKGIGDMVTTTGNSGVTVAGDADHKGGAISAIDLDVKNAQNGAGISFSTNLCDEAGNNRESTPLTVTVTVKKNKDGGYDVGYTLTPAWDGRNQKK